LSEAIALYRLLAAWMLRMVSPDGRPTLPLPEQVSHAPPCGDAPGDAAVRTASAQSPRIINLHPPITPIFNSLIQHPTPTPTQPQPQPHPNPNPTPTPTQPNPNPNPTPTPQQVPMEFATLPEWFVEDMAEVLLYASRYVPHTLSTMRLDDMMLFMVGWGWGVGVGDVMGAEAG